MAKPNPTPVSPITSKQIKEKFTIESSVISGVRKKRKKSLPDISKMKQLLNSTGTAIEDNRRMQELLPDLVLAKKILVSSILSPKDLSTYKMSLYLENNEAIGQTASTALQQIEKHFRTIFDMEGKLPEILGEVLFDVGSYSLLIMPEKNISDLAAQAKAKEPNMYKNNVFVRGTTDFVGLEFMDDITAAFGDVHTERALNDKLTGLYGVGLEGYDESIASLIFNEEAKLPEYPLVKKISAESIIPIHVPGDTKNHIGYYILLDKSGNPLSSVVNRDSLQELKQAISNAGEGNALGGLIRSTNFSISRADVNNDMSSLTEKYVEHMETELLAQLKGDMFPDTLEVDAPEHIYNVMLTRALKKLETRVLYVPKELLHYFAFNYNEYGIGISLLEKTKIFGSLRAILLFAQVMAEVKSSIGRTQLNITLDEDDEDAAKTIETAVHYFAGLQNDSLPLSHLSAGDIVRALQKASVEVNVEGGDAFPGVKTEITDSSRDYAEPNSDLIEILKSMHYAGLGIPPEIVESAMDGETATLVVSRNQLFAKQVIEYASWFELKITRFIRQYVRCSSLLTGVIGNIETDDDSGMLNNFINNLVFRLPKPDLSRIRNIKEAIEEYSDIVDVVVEFYITPDAVSELTNGDMNTDALESIRLSYANLLKREWLNNQNIMPEVGANLDSGEMSNHIKEYNKTILDAIKEITIPVYKGEKELQEALDAAIADPEPEDTNDDTV